MGLIKRLVPEAQSSQMLAASAGLGVVVGAAVAVLEYVTVEIVLHHVLDWPLWVLMFAPLTGLAISYTLLRTLGGGCSPATSEEYVHQFHSRRPWYTARRLQARLLGGVATIGFGGALGLEGPSIYLGSASGFYVHRALERYLGRGAAQQLLTAGAAAGVSALFQAPATGMIFALESPYRDDVAHRALLPSLIASAASFLTFVALPFSPSGSVIGFVTDLSVGTGELLGAVALGVGAGLGGRGFAWCIRRAKTLAYHAPPLLLLVVGGLILGGLAAASQKMFGKPLTLGPGYQVIDYLSEPELATGMVIALFFFRSVATLTTVGSGGVGGLFIPLVVQGVLLGRIVGESLEYLGLGGEDARLWSILGLAAFLAAGYRTPIAAVMFVAESTRGQAVVPALIAAAVSQLVAGAASVSLAQRPERLGGLESRLALPISAALDTNVLTVPSDATISEFVWNHALGQREPVVPVVDGSRYLGLCSIHDATAIDRADWDDTKVTEILDSQAVTGQPSWAIRDVAATMGRSGADLLVVTDGSGSFIGVVRDSDIVKLNEILVETEPNPAADS